MGGILITTAAVIAGCMLALWCLSLVLGDASIVDIFWGLGFVVVAGTTTLIAEVSASQRSHLILLMATIWGLRLAAYLAIRNLGHGEDVRYATMRRHWGEGFWWISLFTVFGLQGVLMWIVSLPLQLAIAAPGAGLSWLDAAGLALWCLGLVFEAVGDWQLTRFKRDPANAHAVMSEGLWRYTRHPNYFGDFCVWWGIFLVALSSPNGAISIVSPIVMSVLLMRVSGVPLLERGLKKRRPEYADYIARTSAFFPRPPMKSPRPSS